MFNYTYVRYIVNCGKECNLGLTGNYTFKLSHVEEDEAILAVIFDGGIAVNGDYSCMGKRIALDFWIARGSGTLLLWRCMHFEEKLCTFATLAKLERRERRRIIFGVAFWHLRVLLCIYHYWVGGDFDFDFDIWRKNWCDKGNCTFQWLQSREREKTSLHLVSCGRECDNHECV